MTRFQLDPRLSPRNGRALKAVGITRISTLNQDIRSLADQQALLRKWVEDRYGGPVEWTFMKVRVAVNASTVSRLRRPKNSSKAASSISWPWRIYPGTCAVSTRCCSASPARTRTPEASHGMVQTTCVQLCRLYRALDQGALRPTLDVFCTMTKFTIQPGPLGDCGRLFPRL
jgi:hypothetical protein